MVETGSLKGRRTMARERERAQGTQCIIFLVLKPQTATEVVPERVPVSQESDLQRITVTDSNNAGWLGI